MKLSEELRPRVHGQPRTYADWVLEQQEIDTVISRKYSLNKHISYSMGLLTNKIACRIRGGENPPILQESPINAYKCAFWLGGVINIKFGSEHVTSRHLPTELYRWSFWTLCSAVLHIRILIHEHATTHRTSTDLQRYNQRDSQKNRQPSEAGGGRYKR